MQNNLKNVFSTIMTYLIILFFLFIFLILFLIVGWSLKNGIGPMPTAPKTKRVLLDNLPNEWHGTIFELGSGWGTLAFPLAKKYPNNTIVAYENSPIPFLISKVRLLFSRHKNLHLKRQDFFYVNFADATMIVCYLYPGAMRQLKGKFEHELRKGTWVISNTFSVPGWQADKILEVHDMYHSKVYMYIISQIEENAKL